MKKIFLTAIAILTVTLSFSQIKITEDVKPIKVGFYKYSDFVKGNLQYTANGTDTTVTLCYYDQRYPSLQTWECFSFYGGSIKAKELQTLLMSFYLEENKDKGDYSVTFTLDGKKVRVSKNKKLLFIYFYDDKNFEKGYTYLNSGNIKSLFGDCKNCGK